MDRKIKIAPSLLAADFSCLADEIRKVEAGGCDMLHVDVMDGHFVPNLTVGPFILKAIRKTTKLPLDVHLMIDSPEDFFGPFADAGADGITFHAEAVGARVDELAKALHRRKLRSGVSLKPATPLAMLDGCLDEIDMVLLMTVNPGFGGQVFMPEVLPKIEKLRKTFAGDIQVDGGINRETSRQAVASGANVLVAGTAIFGKPDAKKAIEDLRCRK